MKLYVILGAILLSLIVGAIGGYYFEKSGIPAKLTAQQSTDKKECEAAQQITKDANDALQKNATIVSNVLTANKLQHPTTCVPVTGTTKHSSGGTKHADTNGASLNSDWLRTYAAQCEQYRGEVTVCTDFLTQERTLIQPVE